MLPISNSKYHEYHNPVYSSSFYYLPQERFSDCRIPAQDMRRLEGIKTNKITKTLYMCSVYENPIGSVQSNYLKIVWSK